MSRPVLTTSGLYTLFGFVAGEMQAPEAKSFLGGADRQVPAASGEGPREGEEDPGGANRAAQHHLPLLLPHQRPVRRPRLHPAVCGTGLLQPDHQGDAAATGLFSTGTDTTVL